MNKKKLNLFFIMITFLLCCSSCGKDSQPTTEQTIIDQEDITIENPQVDSETSSDFGKEKDADGFIVVNDYVKTSGMTINVRVKPSTDADIYRLLEDGVILERTGYNEEWTRIIMDNTNFYIHSDYVVESEPPEGVVVENDIDEDVERKKIVVIDPGNQAGGIAAEEPIAPGSEATKHGASSGNVGVAYGTKEYEINLVYANLLKVELQSRGYTVYLTRDSNNVNITNKARAEFANNTDASVLIRIQMNYSSNDDMTGVMALCMSDDSPYNAELYADSNELATRLLQGIIEQTDAINHGIYESEDMTLINWSEIPVAIIKLGYISNGTEEANLVSASYQNKMVDGIANGLDYYFAE